MTPEWNNMEKWMKCIGTSNGMEMIVPVLNMLNFGKLKTYVCKAI